MYVLDSGRLKKHISILMYGDIETDLGSTEIALKPFKKMWAEIKPIRGNETLQYYRETNTVSHKITIRYTKGIMPDMVVQYKDRFFDIQSVINIDESNKVIELMCTEHYKLERELESVGDV